MKHRSLPEKNRGGGFGDTAREGMATSFVSLAGTERLSRVSWVSVFQPEIGRHAARSFTAPGKKINFAAQVPAKTADNKEQ